MNLIPVDDICYIMILVIACDVSVKWFAKDLSRELVYNCCVRNGKGDDNGHDDSNDIYDDNNIHIDNIMMRVQDSNESYSIIIILITSSPQGHCISSSGYKSLWQ